MSKLRIITIAFAGITLFSCSRNVRPEITWSIMHPTDIDTLYMKRVIDESKGHIVDNFEICGGCNSYCSGSLDGLLRFEEYPLAHASQDSAIVEHNRESLVRIVEMAHEAGKKIYYWHREVLCNDGMVASVPELLDANGEFDLLGSAYESFIRYKIKKTFELVPDLDGLVLTLTEASYSTIHNSSPDIYPPEKVVEKISSIFAEELNKRRKRFIIRSFGSIDEDYKSIEKGVELLAEKYSFEVETKITPYDFSPFMPDNPYLHHTGGCTLSAECDALGEYLGAGRMPAENIEDIIRYVRYAKSRDVERFSIRLDRFYFNVFDSYPINLYAYERAVSNPNVTADQIRNDYYRSLYDPSVADTLVTMSREGVECIRKTLFVDGNVIFHQFPTSAELDLLKTGGFLAAFASKGDLGQKTEQWGMLSQQNVPGRQVIMAEKNQAVKMAEVNLNRLENLREKIDSSDYFRLSGLWKCLYSEAESVRELCRVICGYFDSMEEMDGGFSSLSRDVACSDRVLGDKQYLRPVSGIIHRFLEEYPLEYSMRKTIETEFSPIDYVLPGGILDQIRIKHYMHGVRPESIDGKLYLTVGNKVFPNAFLNVRLKCGAGTRELILIGKGTCVLEVNGNVVIVDLDKSERIPIQACSEEFDVTCRKAEGCSFPKISAIILQ